MPPEAVVEFRVTLLEVEAGLSASDAQDRLIERARTAFLEDVAIVPAMTLRGGAAVDSYDTAMPFDPAVDSPSDAYLEAHAFWGLPHLDAASWRHYLPRLIDHAVRRIDDPGSMLTEALLWSLRPPDRAPPRLNSLSAEQEAVIVAVLDLLAFDERSAHRDLAMQVLEEYWVPGALYRQRPPPGA